MLNLKLVMSEDATDIRLFFENMMKPDVYLTLVKSFGSHEALATAIRTAKKIHFHDKSGFAAFTPSGVEAYLSFAKKASLYAKSEEMIGKMDVLFKKEEIDQLGEILAMYRTFYLVSEVCIQHSLICAMHKNFKIKVEREEKPIINKVGFRVCLDLLFESKDQKDTDLAVAALSDVVNYKFIRDEAFGTDKNIDDYLKRSETNLSCLDRPRSILKRSEPEEIKIQKK